METAKIIFEEMNRYFLAYKNSTIAYSLIGNGKSKVFCFHGYGENAENFAFLAPFLDKNHQLICIELPFHGKTEWNEGLDFNAQDLKEIIYSFLNSEEKCSLLGYSLGGRVALSLYQEIPNSVGRVILIASDGLKVNFWYWLATETFLGKRLFLFTMKNPQWIYGLLKLGHKLKLLNSSIYKFVDYYLKDKEARLILYKRWTCLKSLKPSKSTIKRQIIEKNSLFFLFFGKFDRIIKPSIGSRFIAGIEKNASLIILPGGHILLQNKFGKEIAAALPD